MADFIIRVKDKNNALIKEIISPVPYLDTAPQGSTIHIECRERGYKVQYVGNYFTKSSIETDGVVTNPPVPNPVGLIYDSNVQGLWANGVSRFVTDKEGNTNANGFGFTVNASGKGGFRIDGKGQGTLEPTESGHRRIYPCVCNYNARIEGEFNFLTGEERNGTVQGRNRHQYRDMVDSNAPDSKVQGGIGFSFSIEEQKAGYKVEIVHGTGGERDDFDLPTNLQIQKWYPFKVSYKDSVAGRVNVKSELNFGNGFVTLFNEDISVPSQFFNKTDFDTWSQFWLRLNDKGKLGWRNVRLYAI